ncbi:unnamed protein product [Withania somnifera]
MFGHQKSEKVFSSMHEKDSVACNTLFFGYLENGKTTEGLQLFGTMLRTEVCPTNYTYTTLLSACSRSSDHLAGCGDNETALKFFRKIEKPDFLSWNSMISGYAINGDGEMSSQKVFINVLDKDVVLWTEMIAGHCRIGHKADEFTLNSASIVYDSCLATKTGYIAEMTVCGSLVDMYAKIGNLAAAELMFSSVTMPNLICWNSTLGAYGYHGKAEEAFKVHCGLVNHGIYFWCYMKENGLKTSLTHYYCMITLLSRAGFLEEAENVIMESPFGVELKGNRIIGIRVAKQVLGMDAEDSATNVLLSNFFASTSKWGDFPEIRRKIRGLMLEKDPGLSWLEVTKNTHVFSPSDHSHPQYDEIRAELHRLQENITESETDNLC